MFTCISYEKDIIDIGKCLYKDPKVKEIIADVMVAIATKDFDKLLTQIKEALPDLIKALAGCILDTKVVEDTPKLDTSSIYFECDKTCKQIYPNDKSAYDNCYMMCLAGTARHRRHK